ncbi:hypothetical protein [Cuneatibacter caecimuris]|uniref:Uncharacterized protein n=1 Tax=Cuneatibacter caecimuris TaxID=1796618 RepID=A0A4Q7NYI1_9FIRM|nr:hypothetical protein [Cuneatibacter caecimuris]RZS92090.1 hypothetical protein EV209_3211 [Cuneatibacter caecimuris]
MRGRKRRSFDFGNFEITKREILVSVSIVAIMLLIGVLIAGKISDYQLDKNEKYNKAIKIESRELFEYGMRTNAGNAFVYGDLKAVDTVTYPEIGGEYIYIEKVKERYTMHTRQVAHTTTTNGKTHTYYTTETYWTWDYAGSEERICDEISFLKHVFSVSKIDLPGKEYIDTVKESEHIRYKYYGVGLNFTGTIFTELADKTIADNSPFYENMKIDETVEYLETDFAMWIFWIIWMALIGVSVYSFYYIDNKWLE